MSDVERPGRLARAARTIAAGTLACVSLAACASVPMTGPVVPSEGGDSSGDPYGGYVRLLPAGPQPGVEPEGLIDGFLHLLTPGPFSGEAPRSSPASRGAEDRKTGRRDNDPRARHSRGAPSNSSSRLPVFPSSRLLSAFP